MVYKIFVYTRTFKLLAYNRLITIPIVRLSVRVHVRTCSYSNISDFIPFLAPRSPEPRAFRAVDDFSLRQDWKNLSFAASATVSVFCATRPVDRVTSNEIYGVAH